MELDLSAIEPVPIEDLPTLEATPFEADGEIGNGKPEDPTGGVGLVPTSNPEYIRFVVPIRYPIDSPEKKVFTVSHLLETAYLQPGFKTNVYPRLDDKAQGKYNRGMGIVKKLFQLCGSPVFDPRPEGVTALLDKPIHFRTKQQYNDPERLDIAGYSSVKTKTAVV